MEERERNGRKGTTGREKERQRSKSQERGRDAEVNDRGVEERGEGESGNGGKGKGGIFTELFKKQNPNSRVAAELLKAAVKIRKTISSTSAQRRWFQYSIKV